MQPEEHVAELLPAYVLGTLPADENARVAAHVAQCPACQAEARAYGAVADRLWQAVAQVEPPARVKQGLMARVAPAPAAAAAVWLQRLLPVWSALSLLLIVVLGAAIVMLVRGTGGGREGPMAEVALAATGAAPQATGLLVISADGKYGTLVVDNLPQLPAERQYQVWLERDGRATSGGVFSVNDEGYTSLLVVSPEPLSTYPAFSVTIEPAGGSPSPAGTQVLGGKR